MIPTILDITRFPRVRAVYGGAEPQAEAVAAWLEQGCAVESRLVRGIWQHSFIEPKQGVSL